MLTVLRRVQFAIRPVRLPQAPGMWCATANLKQDSMSLVEGRRWWGQAGARHRTGRRSISVSKMNRVAVRCRRAVGTVYSQRTPRGEALGVVEKANVRLYACRHPARPPPAQKHVMVVQTGWAGWGVEMDAARFPTIFHRPNSENQTSKPKNAGIATGWNRVIIAECVQARTGVL